MIKEFDVWNFQKKKIQIDKPPFFHEREVWFCRLGINVGSEEDGKGNNFLRPILVLKKFNRELLWAVPLTSKIKNGIYYFNLSTDNQQSSAIISQLRLIDARRLEYISHKIGNDKFSILKSKIRNLIS